MTATITTNPNTSDGRLDLRPALVDRAAIRFLLDRRLGRLMTNDTISGEPLVNPVHYIPAGNGTFVTTIPSYSAQARAIREGGDTVLSVTSRTARPPLALADESGALDPAAIWHVQADVEAELIEDAEAVRDIVRGQIHAVLDPMPQGDKSDPLTRAARTTLSRLVGVRLRITGLRARVRGGAEWSEDETASAV